MTVGILPDEIISIDNSKYFNRKPVRNVIEKEINCNEDELDNAMQSSITIHQKRLHNNTSNRWIVRINSILMGAVTASLLNLIFLVVFFTLKDTTIPWLCEESHNYTPISKPTWVDRRDQTLMQVFILFRHGEISPSKDTFPEDVNRNYKWQYGYESLTKKGTERMYKLGQWLRNRYVYLNKGQYDKLNTVAASLDDNYCISSTQALLAGLYPPNPEDSLFNEFLWKPIPVHTVPKQLDNVIGMTAKCDKLDRRRKSLKNDFESTFFNTHKIFLDKLSNVTGINITDIEVLRKLYHIYESQKAEGLTLKNVTKKLPKLSKIISSYLQILFSDSVIQQLKSGPLLDQLMKYMKQSLDSENQNKPNIILYGVNEDVLISLLKSLRVDFFDESLISDGSLKFPLYGSAVIFEIHQDFDDFYPYIKLYHLTDDQLFNVNLNKTCGEECSVKEFRMQNENIVPKPDWISACKINKF